MAASINDHWYRPARIETSAHCIQIKFAYWNAHAPSSEISKAQYATAVRKHNAITEIVPTCIFLKFRFRVLLQNFFQPALFRDAQVTTSAIQRHLTKLLACLAHSGRVHRRQNQGRFSSNSSIKKVHVSVAELPHVGVCPKIVAQRHDGTHFAQRILHSGGSAHGTEHSQQLFHVLMLCIPCMNTTSGSNSLRQRQFAARCTIEEHVQKSSQIHFCIVCAAAHLYQQRLSRPIIKANMLQHNLKIISLYVASSTSQRLQLLSDRFH
mmetsp:Transcript_24194/g.45876  ORF Transcript_24194/g.45876 Transcript_24194/m.45876 type:complete len:266 (-) Transcript_24194:54-851(-)